ncbi:MAG: Nif3-like dinuclear metal center hexameric protein [Proteobacteria bacterium]|nr:Nif3-like dinuclear metal center hexameric protein [Pseudomonadota bacterium]
MATVGDIITLIEKHIARPHLAEPWDNCGLQMGDRSWPVRKIVTALDPLWDVVDYACSIKADLLVTHHPLIFKPMKSLDFSNPLGRIISQSHTHSLAIYSAHTNFDSTKGGLNDILARKMGLTGIRVLGRPVDPERLKLVIFAPLDHKENILGALSETAAGIIGNYTCCSFLCKGKGRFTSGQGANPFLGIPGELTDVDEVRIETLVLKRDAQGVIDHVAKVHPYDTMAYDLYPLVSDSCLEGLGRIGRLEHPLPFKAFVQQVKDSLGLDTVKVAGNRDMMIGSVALCTGSGSGMIGDFIQSHADVYVSGDLHYHDARRVEDAGRTLVDVGHFASEIPMAQAMKDALTSLCGQKGFSIAVEACAMEKDPFIYI